MSDRLFRARRVLLFCPGTERRMIEKAARLDADGVILDLEDAAALSRKRDAREISMRALAELDFGQRERLLRINPTGSGLDVDDLAALAKAPTLPDALVVPKVESAEAIQTIAKHLTEIEDERGTGPGTVEILAIVESARGVTQLSAIASAHPRLTALVFGAEDLAGDLGARRTRAGWEVFYARSAVVLHAAAARIQAIDTPFVDLSDLEGLADEARVALDMGYAGKLAIHPRQVPVIQSVFTPSPDEVAAARRLVEAHDAHQAEGRGVFELDGRMVDMPMVRAAQRVLARARGSE